MPPHVRLLIALLLVTAADGVRAEVPTGDSGDGECIACHRARDPALTAAWARSAHGGDPPAAPCTACHGTRHEGALGRARRSADCVRCHCGPQGEAVRTHALSKHGVIARLEGGRWDWSRPLAGGAYRAPTCAYCHQHRSGHDPGAVAAPEAALAVCIDCHAPRYAARILESGARTLAIGRMKLREAEQAVEAAVRAGLSAEALDPARARLEVMRRHIKSLRLGAAHHSPDDQWWHGQAALDGDLLRIKGAIGRALRRQDLEARRGAGDKGDP